MKEQIEEMAKIFADVRDQYHCRNRSCAECPYFKVDSSYCEECHFMEALYNAGYSKQSAVIDEFAKRLKEKMNDLSRMEYNCVPYFLVSKSFIDKIAAEMKGGAE